MAFEDAASVGVDHEDFVLTGVEQDGVGGFRGNAVQREEFRAKFRSGPREHYCQRAVVVVIKMGDEDLEPSGLLTEVSGGTDVLFELRQRRVAYSGEGEHACAAQVGEGEFDVGP